MHKHTIKQRAAKMVIAGSILASSLSLGTSAFAFSDLKGDPAEAKIEALYKAGIISGVSSDLFAPKSKLNVAQAVKLIVAGLDLKPQGDAVAAASSFSQVKAGAWYASAFETAKQNGLTLEQNVSPAASMTRAQFAHLLMQGLDAKGPFPVTKMYFEIRDGSQLPEGVNHSLQVLLNARIISLDENGKFRPNDPVTRSEAAVWVYNAAELAKRIAADSEQTEGPKYVHETKLNVTKAGEGVNKVTLTVTNLPNPGYGVAIERVEFGKDKTAVITFSITKPSAGSMNAQVISEASAVTYVPEGYTPVAKESNADGNGAIKLSPEAK